MAREGKRWRHTFPFDGLQIDGDISLVAQAEKRSVLPDDLSGKSVLDVGANDGYYSIVAERRGARHVVAIDASVLAADKFSIVKQALDSDVEYVVADVNSVELTRRFDVTIFFGVLYHLHEPEAVLDKVTELTGETLCIETACKPAPLDGESLFHTGRPNQNPFFRAINEVGDHRVVCWPTRKWIDECLRERGFTIVERNVHVGSMLRSIVPFASRIPQPHRIVPTRYALRAERT